MERPSNLIIAFVLAIAGVFLAFAVGRIVVFVFPNDDTEIELEEDYESRIDSEDYITNYLLTTNKDHFIFSSRRRLSLLVMRRGV